MFRWFKKHFIPHKGNDHQPHFLRGKNTRNLVVIVLALEFIVLLMPFIPVTYLMGNRFSAIVLPSVLDDLTNQNRQAQHLAVLTVNPLLNEVAQLKAQDMAAKGYFAHTSPDGKAPWYWFKQVGYDYSYAGENLAVDFTDSQDVAVAWMNSPEHKANILKDAYTEVGTGVAAGTYQGRPTIFVAQEFGQPASVVVAAAVAPAVAPAKVTTRVTSTTVPNTTVPKVASTSKVLGVETIPVATQTPAAVAPIAAAPTTVTPTIDKKPAQSYAQTNIFEKYLTSPRHVVNIILAFLAMLVALAILLKLFIRMDKRHPRLITNGLVVLVLIFGVYIANDYIANAKMAVTTSFASFQGEQFDQGR